MINTFVRQYFRNDAAIAGLRTSTGVSPACGKGSFASDISGPNVNTARESAPEGAAMLPAGRRCGKFARRDWADNPSINLRYARSNGFSGCALIRTWSSHGLGVHRRATHIATDEGAFPIKRKVKRASGHTATTAVTGERD